MARRRKDEALEVGRMAGILSRKDPELWEMVKQVAEEEGTTVSDVISKAVRAYVAYEKYKDVDGATIMKVLDILDRIYQYMDGWRRSTTLVEMVDTVKSLEEIASYMAPRLGYVSPDELRELEDKLRKRVEQEIMERYSKTGRVSGILDKVIDKLVDNITSSIVEKLEKHGILDDLAKIAEQAAMEAAQVGANEDVEVELIENKDKE